jgi:hypothetical protein
MSGIRGWRGAAPVAALLVGAVLLAACGSDPAPSDGPAAVPVTGEGADAGFVLQVTLPSAAFAASDAIAVATTVMWQGAAAKAGIWGSGMGPVSFVFTEVGGFNRTMGGVMSGDCGLKEFPRGVPVAIPFQKAGAYSGDDPQAAFYRA